MTKSKKKDFVFNTIGGVIYALNSVILLLLVVQIIGTEKGGVFSIAFTISQTLAVIGSFEMRAFQATDTGTYRIQDYFLSRIYTSVLMIAASIVWIVKNGYEREKAVIVFILCAYRLSDSFGDVIEGYFQQKDKLYISGIFLALRSGIPMVVFIVILLFTRNLLISCIFLFISAMLMLLILDFYSIIFKEKIRLTGGKTKEAMLIIKVCLPLFLSGFLSTYIINAPKYAIDKYLTQEMQTFYSIIFMPTFAINLVSGFLFKPYLLDVAMMWKEKQTKRIYSLLCKMTLIILGITLMCVCLGWFVGIPVLSWIYGVNELAAYKTQFIINLIGGGFNALCAFLYHMLIVMRRQRAIFFTYLIVFLEAVILSNFWVVKAGITGASLTYLICIVSIVFIFGCIIYSCQRKDEK